MVKDNRGYEAEGRERVYSSFYWVCGQIKQSDKKSFTRSSRIGALNYDTIQRIARVPNSEIAFEPSKATRLILFDQFNRLYSTKNVAAMKLQDL